MTFTPKLPVPRRRPASAAATDDDVSLEELYRARRTAARYVQLNTAVLPIFERIEKEIEIRESRMRALSRAAAVAAETPYIEGHVCPERS